MLHGSHKSSSIHTSKSTKTDPMPLISAHNQDPAVDGRQSDHAMMIRTGVMRGLTGSGLVFAAELTLANGRRADLVGLDKSGKITIVEIKSSIADFKADTKWHEYKDFSDHFYFATHPDVPVEIFPEEEGLIIADNHGCEILREAQVVKLPAPTRKALTLRFARTSGSRLKHIAMHNTGPGEALSSVILASDEDL